MPAPVRLADRVEAALIEVSEDAHTEFGPNEADWTPAQVREYLLRLDVARVDAGWVVA
jgi:1,6-anhydro-N-acetylmuramate kinase